MGLKRKKYEERTVHQDFGDEGTLTIVYNARAISVDHANALTAIEVAPERGVEAILEALNALIIRWDLLVGEDDVQRLQGAGFDVAEDDSWPTETKALELLDIRLIGEVFWLMMRDMSPKATSERRSGGSFSRAG
jgi:hypothetical protein